MYYLYIDCQIIINKSKRKNNYNKCHKQNRKMFYIE